MILFLEEVKIYYPQVFLEESKSIFKEKKVPEILPLKEKFPLLILIEKILMKKILMKKILMKKKSIECV